MKCKRFSQEENELRQKEQFLATEVEDLRGKLRDKDEESLQVHTREERMQRQCQQVKAQLD